ncbi:hypothetical protein, partial [Yersinia ruckeri]|uniref:hypothetical protein n=1 Tax=Yersinia ruckeri TaxID=29486 RepID=UPI00223711C2
KYIFIANFTSVSSIKRVNSSIYSVFNKTISSCGWNDVFYLAGVEAVSYFLDEIKNEFLII